MFYIVPRIERLRQFMADYFLFEVDGMAVQMEKKTGDSQNTYKEESQDDPPSDLPAPPHHCFSGTGSVPSLLCSLYSLISLISLVHKDSFVYKIRIIRLSAALTILGEGGSCKSLTENVKKFTEKIKKRKKIC